MEEFFELISSAFSEESFVKLTLSKPRNKQTDLQNLYASPVLIKNERLLQFTYRHTTKDIAKNYPLDEAVVLLTTMLQEQFFNATMSTTTHTISLLQNKKGKVGLVKKLMPSAAVDLKHDKQKARLIEVDEPFLHSLGITSSNQKVFAKSQKKFKQINNYIDIIDGLLKDATDVSEIYDMGSGKGYLTFALYTHLSTKNAQLQVRGVELRPDLVEKCNLIAKEHKLKGLHFLEGSIADFSIEKADMVIALHACDIATDMAIAQGVKAKAKYIVVAPCCHKQIRKAMNGKESHLSSALQYGIYQERLAEILTDTMRALLLNSLGYTTKVFEFVGSEHAGKNSMITAVYTGKKDAEALTKIAKLKAEYKIARHYLEGII